MNEKLIVWADRHGQYRMTSYARTSYGQTFLIFFLFRHNKIKYEHTYFKKLKNLLEQKAWELNTM